MNIFDPQSAAQAWIHINRLRTRVFNDIESRLKAENLPGLDWYDVLWELEKSPDGFMRPARLHETLLMPQHNLSRLLHRMLEAGLIRKTPCPDDARSQRVSLTEAGRALRLKMWAVYEPAIQSGFDTEDSRRDIAAILDDSKGAPE